MQSLCLTVLLHNLAGNGSDRQIEDIGGGHHAAENSPQQHMLSKLIFTCDILIVLESIHSLNILLVDIPEFVLFAER